MTQTTGGWVTASPAPVRSEIACWSWAFDQQRHALTDPDAQGREPAVQPAALEPAQQGDQDPRPGRAERVTERDGAAFGVDDRVVELEPLHHGEALGGERLVQLDRL